MYVSATSKTRVSLLHSHKATKLRQNTALAKTFFLDYSFNQSFRRRQLHYQMVIGYVFHIPWKQDSATAKHENGNELNAA